MPSRQTERLRSSWDSKTLSSRIQATLPAVVSLTIFLRDDHRVTEDPYRAYGTRSDSLSTLGKNFGATKAEGRFPVLRFAGLQNARRDSPMSVRQQCLDILRKFFVGSPSALVGARRMRTNSSLTQTDATLFICYLTVCLRTSRSQ